MLKHENFTKLFIHMDTYSSIGIAAHYVNVMICNGELQTLSHSDSSVAHVVMAHRTGLDITYLITWLIYDPTSDINLCDYSICSIPNDINAIWVGNFPFS